MHFKKDSQEYQDWCLQNKGYVNISEANDEDKESYSEYVLMMSTKDDNADSWIIVKVLVEIDFGACSRSICVANGSQSKSEGKCTCKINTNSTVLCVTDVYFVPEFKGYKVSF